MLLLFNYAHKVICLINLKSIINVLTQGSVCLLVINNGGIFKMFNLFV